MQYTMQRLSLFDQSNLELVSSGSDCPACSKRLSVGMVVSLRIVLPDDQVGHSPAYADAVGFNEYEHRLKQTDAMQVPTAVPPSYDSVRGRRRPAS